ncbi:MAG: alanine--tRNA ligase [Methanothermobacter sp.]|nr:alanine--tRNA ligase [Methanothermobacter sp.]
MSHQLKKLGYEKKKCKSCGKYFWSIDERETCGDAPCDPYTFIGDPPTKKKYDLYKIQNTFIQFFKERGHEPIKRYPVLAKRWRDDVFLVGASIYNFQPWVTSGMVKPPANPLVVAQPSIRLNDIDNVGRTGRHLTCFTMGGHHAFNSPENQIYWENETIKYCHDFLKHIGINPKEATFIESWWEGGGNAGPCYEVCVRGVELATLVFIQYEILPDSKKKEIPLKIVDTGYGLERFAWISQGTPTAYDASFGPVIQRLKELASIEVNEEILKENAQVAGMMDIQTYADLKTLRRRVADKLGIPVKELEASAKPMESIYAIADHTRCLAFMLADGVIPSNVKEGYLARLIIRRAIRLLDELHLKESLKDIMEIQIDFLEPQYPEIREHHQHIIDIIELEEKRYKKTIQKGERIVKKTIKHFKKEGKKEIPVKTLIKLYDSHGIPPEIVKEISNAQNFKLRIPDNFYTLVAQKHEKEEETETTPIKLDYPQTKLLFYENPNETKFKAKIIGIHENGIILDQTLFYPEGGGQPSDKGMLKIGKSKLKVEYAEKIGDIVLHRTNADKIPRKLIGKTVEGTIDWERRMALTRNHTGTHLIVAAARQVLGDHIWQTGAQKGIKQSRIDLSHYKRIKIDEIEKIEELANKYVMENIPVKTKWIERNLAEKKYGFILYQGGVVPGNKIRIVKIGEIDVQACGGTHVPQTGDIGPIKINRTERIQDGVERIEFSVGEAAIKQIQNINRLLIETSKIFKVPVEQLPRVSERFFKEWKAFKNEIKRLKEEIALLKIEKLTEKTQKIDNLLFIGEIVDAKMDEMQEMALKLTEDKKIDITILLNNDGKIVGASSSKAIKKGIKINELIKKLAKILGGGGGGRPNLAQGAGPKTHKINEVLEEAQRLIEATLEG